MFKQQLLSVRNDQINHLIDAHDTELRSMLAQVDVECIKSDLFSQARQLLPRVCVVRHISTFDFFNRHRSLLKVKNAFYRLDEYYRTYPDVVMLLERLRNEFSGLVVGFDVVDNQFNVTITGDVAPLLD
jgi:hypothetical protein